MPRLTRAAKQALTRDKLVQAAHTVFAAHGFAGASIDVIAEAAEFSKGAFYSNFPSKEAIGLEVLRQLVEEELRALESVADSLPHPAEAAFAALAATYAFRSMGPRASLLGLELMLQARHNPGLRTGIASIYQARSAAKAALVARVAARTGRRLGVDAAIAADLISAIGHGHAALASGGAEPSPLGTMIEVLLRALLQPAG